MSESMAILQAIMSVASSIVLTTDSQRHSATTPAPYTATLIDIPQFMSPDSLYPRLNDLGLPNDVSIRMSAAYMRRAEILQSSVEEALRTAYTKLVAHPWDPDAMPLDLLRQKIFVQQHHVYQTTLSKWQDDIIHLARSRLDRLQAASSQSSAKVPSTVFTKKSKRRFKSEYLPLFEFAFEKDRFPSREDKKHLARISGMSYRQVCVWFQNRRCRRKYHSQHPTSAPQTFAEMKAHLSASARESLANPSSLRKNCQNQNKHAGTEEVDPVISSPKVLDDTMSPGSSCGTRAVSLEATEDGYESDDQDELISDDCMGNTTYCIPPSISDNDTTSPFSSPESTSSPASEANALDSTNPFNATKAPTAHVYPAVYKPSALTSDPFIVEHHAWLRYPSAPRARPLIDLTSEAMEDILGGFNGMDVDDVDIGETKKPLLHPRRNLPTNSSSCGSEPSLSRSSSYSTISSSCSDLLFMTPSDCTEELSAVFVPSPVSDREGNTWTNSRVEAWVRPPNLEEQPSSSKWEQLLAAASVAAP